MWTDIRNIENIGMKVGGDVDREKSQSPVNPEQ